jgi:hypothetical protein
MNVLSWNVLHREHEIRYQPRSKILKSFPDDTVRLKEIVVLLVDQSRHETIICLQEVCKELYDLVRATFSLTHDVFSQQISDIEFLVTVTPKFLECTDELKPVPGVANGLHILSNSWLRIVNCHLKPQFVMRDNVLSAIRNVQHPEKFTIVAGDFNETSKKIREAIGKDFRVPYYGLTYKGRKGIDHVLFNRNIRYKAGVVQTKTLSDHNPIILNLFP